MKNEQHEIGHARRLEQSGLMDGESIESLRDDYTVPEPPDDHDEPLWATVLSVIALIVVLVTIILVAAQLVSILWAAEPAQCVDAWTVDVRYVEHCRVDGEWVES